MSEDERIARAAGYTPETEHPSFWERRRTVQVTLPNGSTVGGELSSLRYEGPNWRDAPDDVTLWLLPVLQKRFMSFTTGYNDHKTCYATFEQHHTQAIENGELSQELIEAARSRGGLWELNAYPDTPVGSATFYAIEWHEVIIEAILWNEKESTHAS